MNFRLSLLAVSAIAAVSAMPATAATYVYTGTTAGGPAYNRTVAGTPPTGLSAAGTAVAYNAFSFTVSTSGSYSFLNSSVYDNFLSLYQGVFNPASPLTNILVAADDTVGSNAGFSRALIAGQRYVSVMTSFSNSDAGAFTLTIDGPGNVTPSAGAVPETATWGMMIAGFGMMGAAMRTRRRSIKVSFA
jgi:hypothetical protein